MLVVVVDEGYTRTSILKRFVMLSCMGFPSDCWSWGRSATQTCMAALIIYDGQPKQLICCCNPSDKNDYGFYQANEQRAAMLQEEKVQCLAWILQRSQRILLDTCCIPSGSSGMSPAAMLWSVCYIVWASWRRTEVLFSTASTPQLSFFSSCFPGKKSGKAGLSFKSWPGNDKSQQQQQHPDWKLHF